MKNIIIKMKKTLEWINSGLDETEGWISDLEDKVTENREPKLNGKKKKE